MTNRRIAKHVHRLERRLKQAIEVVDNNAKAMTHLLRNWHEIAYQELELKSQLMSVLTTAGGSARSESETGYEHEPETGYAHDSELASFIEENSIEDFCEAWDRPAK